MPAVPPQFLHQWLDFLCISEASEEDKTYLIASFAKSLSDKASKRRDAFEFVYTLQCIATLMTVS